MIKNRKGNNLLIRLSILFVAILLSQSTEAQGDEIELFRMDDEKVYTSEFIRVFQKNQEIVIEDGDKDFDSYFELFVDFKLKLKQAYELQLDTSELYINELEKYKEQLIVPYLQNPESIELLVKEAYNRTINEVNASHILIRVNSDAKPTDTIRAYQKIEQARKKVIQGTPFEQVAIEFSEDPSVNSNRGNLGYFSAFSMVYAFENVAYNTKVGEVSLPFRTQFGYHIVKTNNLRSSRGEIEVAHIMVKNIPGDSISVKKKIDDIYSKIVQGGDFAKIAQEHSDDLRSAEKGGVLPKFGTGRMIGSFEDNAFSLDNIGDYTKPFQTDYGWHIIVLLKKFPIQSFELMHDQLKSKIKNGSRSKYVQAALAYKLAVNYSISEDLNVLTSFYIKDNAKMKSNKTLLNIENNLFTSNDFYEYSITKKNKNIAELYVDFKNEKIIDYYKDHLEFTEKEFAEIYKEYKDGLLLFELLEKVIWDKAQNDSIGLQKYYNKNKNNYKWGKRGEITIASCTTIDKAKLVKQYLEEGKSLDSIKNSLNKGATIHVLFSSGTLEEGSSKLPKRYKLTSTGVSEIFNDKKNHYTIIKVDRIMEPTVKMLEESKGEVINDYQNYLEEKWVKSLHKMYKVRVNKKVLKKLKLQYADI